MNETEVDANTHNNNNEKTWKSKFDDIMIIFCREDANLKLIYKWRAHFESGQLLFICVVLFLYVAYTFVSQMIIFTVISRFA